MILTEVYGFECSHPYCDVSTFLHQLNMVLERFLHFSGVNAEISLGDIGRGVLEKFHDKDYVVAVGFI